MNFYDQYKPFRNFIRRFDWLTSLLEIWRYSLHVIDRHPLPKGFLVGKPLTETVDRNVYPWHLDILARELAMHAGTRGDRNLRQWRYLADAINHIHDLEGTAFDIGRDRDIFLETHRLVHRQFPWQTSTKAAHLVRILKVFGQPEMEKIVVQALGMTTRQSMLLGASMAGHFNQNGIIPIDTGYGALGIPQEASKSFIDRITCTRAQLAAQTKENQSYDQDWFYTWNPLENTPLISLGASSNQVICPIPQYLLRRASDGIFYDVVNVEGFNNAFGNSFQSYVGEVISATCPPPSFILLAEEPYYVGKNLMHGVDWVLSDSTGHLFIECKTKRLRLDAKVRSDSIALDADLDTMAKAIAQHYANIQRALDERTPWHRDALPIYPLILTFEDWIIFNSSLHQALTDRVGKLLSERNLSPQMVNDYPYTVAAAHEFERAAGVIAQVGISSVMGKKTESSDQRLWGLLPFLDTEFTNELKRAPWLLFPDDWQRLWPNQNGALIHT